MQIWRVEMSFSIEITKRDRKRKLKSGAVVVQTRYVLNFSNPKTGKRKQLFFERQKDAQAKRNEILTGVETGSYTSTRKSPTVDEALAHWMENRDGQVKARTLAIYKGLLKYIVGPLLIGTRNQRHAFTTTGKRPPGTRLEPLLGSIKVSELT